MSEELNKQENEETTDKPDEVKETAESTADEVKETADEHYEGILGDFAEQETAQAAEEAAAPKEKKPSGKKGLAIAGICAGVLALGGLGTFGVLKYREVMPKTAASSAHYRVTDRMTACYIQDTVNMYLSRYGEDAMKSYYGLDVSLPLSEQESPNGDGSTWLDTMKDTVKTYISQYLVLKEAGMENGHVLSAADRKTIEDTITEIDLTKYGNGVTVSDVRAALELQAYAAGVYNDVIESFDFTDDEIQAYMDANGSSYVTCGMMGFSISYDKEDTDDAADPAAADDAAAEETKVGMDQKTAEKLAKSLEQAKSEDDFEKQVSDILVKYEGYSDEELESLLPTIRNDNLSYMSGNELADWAFGGEAEVGDTLLIEGDGVYYVYYMTRLPERDESPTVNVRHILFSVDDHLPEGVTEPTDEDNAAAMEECRKLAQAALDEWKSGEATEDSFGELANRVSEDPGSNTTGGLYTSVVEGQMITEFNDWCFDEARQTGDSGLVETSYGVHVMYFSGKGDPIWKANTIQEMRGSEFENWFTEQKDKYEVTFDDEIIASIEG